VSGATVSAWPRFPVGLEEGRQGGALVHSFTVPGCVARGPTKEEALDAFGPELGRWLLFLESAGEIVPDRDRELDVTVDEWILTGAEVSRGESDVCFEADRLPLTGPEVHRGLRILGALRGRLVPLIRRAPDEALERFGSEGATARVILDELARAQWFTLTRLGASPLAEVPPRAVGRLDTAMALIVQQLTALDGDRLGSSIEMDGEEWTPRKVIRRLLWLEWELGGAALEALRNPSTIE
jgi:predicted RNase H-like HicB family nuclease